MKCQILFSGKNKKKIINLSSAENAQRVVKVKKLKSKVENPTPLFLYEEISHCFREDIHKH